MIKFIKNFRKDDSGAVTVDWVVLTAAVAALAGAVFTAVQDGAEDLTGETGAYLSSLDPDATSAAATN